MAVMTFTIEGEVPVEVVVTEQADGTLKFDFDVLTGENGETAELNGVFFDLAADVDTDYGSLTASDGTSGLDTSVAEGDVSNLGGGINLKGDVVKEYGAFDMGIVADETGLGNSEDLQSFSFVLDAETPLTLEDVYGMDFGVRLTSVGIEGDREGSLKLGATAPSEADEEVGGEDPPGDDDDLGGIDPEGPGDGATEETPEDGTNTDDPGAGEPSPDPLLDEWFAVQKDETGGDTDGDVLANDDAGLTVVSVTNSAGDVFGVVEGGTTVPGTEGGTLTIHPDGTVDFDAGEDFANLYDGESADVVYSYTTDSNQTASLTVTVDGAGAPDDGTDEPLLPPIEDEGTIDPTLDPDPDEALLSDDVMLG